MDLINIVIILLVILLSMTLHEAMHAFMGYFLGDDTARAQGRLTLNPLKHIDPFMTILLPLMMAFMGGPIFGGAKPVPFNPNNLRYGEWGAALVAIAGPLTNFLLAFFAFGIGVVSGVITEGGLIQTSVVGNIFSTFIMVNLGFFLFNILPIPPLDGSRVMYAIAPDVVQKGMQQIERYGLILIFVLVLIGGPVLSKILMAIITFFINIFSAIFQVV